MFTLRCGELLDNQDKAYSNRQAVGYNATKYFRGDGSWTGS
ncbi:MAG: hypothetical protein ACJAUL_002758 [Paraglaciecola sp.]